MSFWRIAYCLVIAALVPSVITAFFAWYSGYSIDALVFGVISICLLALIIQMATTVELMGAAMVFSNEPDSDEVAANPELLEQPPEAVEPGDEWRLN